MLEVNKYVVAIGKQKTEKRKDIEGNGNPLQCSCLGNPMHRGAWQATVHGVTEELDTVTERSVFVEILKTAMSFIEWSSICG